MMGSASFATGFTHVCPNERAVLSRGECLAVLSIMFIAHRNNVGVRLVVLVFRSRPSYVRPSRRVVFAAIDGTLAMRFLAEFLPVIDPWTETTRGSFRCAYLVLDFDLAFD